ncbi:DEAD/DEAH box helicase [Cellulosimicrobium marinum]|uniref:DEAD/DEAH box helicase n=1 Tax=Cellulosimicrobium marinum TaxID=1638992 RepID=UPI001E58F20B|nr:DEAD/DEAH box helicase family protein [Cellulosimicrobium marinum]MCB7138261.1 DEAD/DEAH box helicase family protein [Cellulosimicrobium marinum]
MKYELFDYQEAAVAALSKHLIRAARDHAEDPDERTAVVLSAPTGAGKTVIATGVIEASLDGDEATPGVEGATFLWVTDDPSLNRQTLQKMMDSASDLQLNRLTIIENDFDEEIFEPGRVYFLNIQKLSATANLSKSGVDGRTYSLWETIANTVAQRPHGFVVVIDEAHRGTTSTAVAGRTRETIVSQIIGGGTTGRPAAPVVWGISATPGRFLAAMAESGRTTKQHTVAIEDVRASGLLKEQIVLGHTQGVDAAESSLVRFAVERVRTYEQKWVDYTASTGEPAVHPALVIQVADRPTAQELGTVIATVLEEWPEIDAGAVVHTFADHAALDAGAFQIPWCPPEDIQDRTDVRVVLCKTAITTGWDCPRAEVLLSFRVARDLDLITQVMGRMVRTPLARRIDTDQDLNAVHCILPSFDAAAVDAIAERFQVGDAETLATGTTVIVDAVELTRNPTFAAPAPAPVPASVAEPQADADDDGFELVTADEAAPPPASTRQDDTATVPGVDEAVTTAVGQGEASGGLFDAADAPVHELTAGAETSVFDVIAALPSYTIPRRTLRSPIDRLTQMAILLAGEHDGTTIDAKAPLKAKNELLAVIDTHRAVLQDAGELDDLVRGAGITRLYERTVGFADPDAASTDTSSDLVLDTRGVQILLKRAEAVLPQGLANAYIKRLAVRDEQIREAQLTTIALTTDDTLPGALKDRASQLVEQWFKDHGGAITRLPAPEQERFDRIKREADRPLPTTITLPSNKTESSSGSAWDRHILSDANGIFRAELQGWEEHVLRAELDAGALAWYRNPATGRHSLQIPYVTSGGIRGLAVDFVFVHQVAGELRASLIDPHGTHLADAVDKLKGLTEYAAKHSADYHRIQSIALVDDTYLMLNHKDPAIRTAIADFDGTDSRDLFRTHGTRY